MGVVGRVVQSPRRAAAKHVGVDGRGREPAPKADMEAGSDVAHSLQLGPHPAVVQPARIAAELALLVLLQRLEGGFGGQHPAFHRGVAALDLGHIDESGGTADEGAAGEGELGNRLESAFVDRPGAIGDAPAALEQGTDRRMGLEALEFLEGAEPGVGIVEADDEADGYLPILEMIEEGAAVDVAGERPADRMDDLARLMLGRIDLPELLEADAVGLRIGSETKLVAFDQLLGEGTTAAFGEQGELAVQLDPGREIGRRLAILADAHIARRHALDPAVVVVKDFRRRETRIDLYA